MSKKPLGEVKQKVPVLAVVMQHPTDPNKLLIQMNDNTPIENRIDFCLGCAITFIGHAGELIEQQRKSGTIEKPPTDIIVPTLQMRGPLQ